MKKSELRNIIKEELKNLKEQNQGYTAQITCMPGFTPKILNPNPTSLSPTGPSAGPHATVNKLMGDEVCFVCEPLDRGGRAPIGPTIR